MLFRSVTGASGKNQKTKVNVSRESGIYLSRYLIWCVYMRTIYAEYNINHDSIDVYTSAGYMLRIDCWKAEKNLKTTYGSECALTSLAVDEPLEYARLYLEGNLQMWVDAEDSLEL